MRTHCTNNIIMRQRTYTGTRWNMNTINTPPSARTLTHTKKHDKRHSGRVENIKVTYLQCKTNIF